MSDAQLDPFTALYADAEGTIARGRLQEHPAPCIACTQPAGVTFQEQFIHIPCWWASTADSRAHRHSPAGHAAVAHGAVTITTAALTASVSTADVPTADEPGAPAGTAGGPADAPAAAASAPTPSRATAASAPTPGRARSRFTAPAAVLDVDGLWLPDGTVHPLEVPVRHVGDVAQLVERFGLGTKVTDRRVEPGQIWLTAAVLAEMGLDLSQLPADTSKRVEVIRQVTHGAPLVELARAQGWQVGGTGDRLSTWTRVWRGEQRGVWVALIPGMSTDPKEMPVLGDDPAPGALARRLGLFAEHLRAPWTLTPHTTGIDLMITLRARDRERLFAPRPPVRPAEVANLEAEINWSRVPGEAERAMRYAHAYDRGGSHAAGVAGLELGIGEAVHHPDGVAFDPKLPGYHLVEIPDADTWQHPHPLNPRGNLPARPVWVTTPTLQLGYEAGYEVKVLEAYVWPEHGRVLDPWYERIRDARAGLDVDDVDSQLARDLLKVVYTRTIGMLGSHEWMSDRYGYDPARRHHIVAKARANLLRRVMQIGRDSGQWPVAMTQDTIVYASDEPDPHLAWPGQAQHWGRGFGQFKHEATGLLADQLPYLNGRDYRGKGDLLLPKSEEQSA